MVERPTQSEVSGSNPTPPLHFSKVDRNYVKSFIENNLLLKEYNIRLMVFFAPVFSIKWVLWISIVLGLIWSASEISLLEYPLQGIIHQSNCMHTMGSGIAKRIREKYPEAYSADMEAGAKGDSKRLGCYSVAHCLKEDKYIFNLYGQEII